MGTERLRSAVFFIQYFVLLLFVPVWLQFGYVQKRISVDMAALYGLYGFAVVYVAARAYLVLSRRLSEQWEYAWLTVDLGLISLAVALTGGINSEAAIWYFWPLATSSIQRRPRRTLGIGLAIAALYVYSVLAGPHDRDAAEKLVTRVLLLLVVSGLAAYYALVEISRVNEITRLREQLALSEYRTRLAQEMHDGVQHYLVNMASRLELARGLVETEPARAAALAIDQRITLRQAADELRYLVGRLRSPLLEREGFVEALRHNLSRAATRSALSTPLHVEGAVRPLPEDVEHAAFRIIQEALTNAEKHARATRVEVWLRFEPDHFECAVTDDGVGFEAAASPDGDRARLEFGLDTMKQRAASVGGDLEVTSAPGQGTTVRLRVPLAEPYSQPTEAMGHGPHPAAHC